MSLRKLLSGSNTQGFVRVVTPLLDRPPHHSEIRRTLEVFPAVSALCQTKPCSVSLSVAVTAKVMAFALFPTSTLTSGEKKNPQDVRQFTTSAFPSGTQSQDISLL